MTMRTRKFIGTIIFILGMTIYALLAMVFADIVTDRHWLVQLAFFTVAGLVWVPPAGLLITWMQRPDEVEGDDY